MSNHRLPIPRIIIASLILALAMARGAAADPGSRISVIYDSDFSGDFDDVYGLAMLLKSPRFEVKLVTTTGGEKDLHARFFAKFLSQVGRSDIPIGLGGGGRDDGRRKGPYWDWVKGYELRDYPGTVIENGVQAMVDLVNTSAKPITIIGNGPMETLGAALRLDPGFARKADLVVMVGNIAERSKEGKLIGEQNAHQDPAGTRLVFAAPWKSALFIPLDATAVWLSYNDYRKVHQVEDPVIRTLTEMEARFVQAFHANLWEQHHGLLTADGKPVHNQRQFAAVTVFLADPARRDQVTISTLSVRVEDNGETTVSPAGHAVDVATAWKDKPAFEARMAEMLASPLQPAARTR